MKTFFITLLGAMLCTFTSWAQTSAVKGKITDKATGESVPFATIRALSAHDSVTIGGATSDFDGIYKIDRLDPGPYIIQVNYIGYHNLRVNVELVADEELVLNMRLEESNVELQSVEIQADRMLIRGSRPSASQTFIDGIRVRGRNKQSRRYKTSKSERFFMGQTTPAAETNTEQYKGLEEGGFKSPLKEPLSTFSIDVDVASYSNMRRFITDGQLPPPDAVRIEEMINYFPYDYEGPEDEHPFAVHSEWTQCHWNEKHQLVRVAIQGERSQTDELPASNLVLLLDVSGSMNDPKKLPLLKKSLYLLVEELDEKDRIAIVVYAGAAGLVLKSTRCDRKKEIKSAISNLSAGGSTAGGQGIKLAYNIAEQHLIKNGNNRVILATDGDFNVGVSSDEALKKLIEKKRESGIFLSVLGFGTGNYKDAKMETLADHGNGNYAYIDNLMEAHKVLVTEMTSTIYTIAKDVKLQVEFNPALVQAYRLVGYENRLLAEEDFDDDLKDAGELGAGHNVTAIYEIIPTGVKSDYKIPGARKLKYQTNNNDTVWENSDELMTVKLRYKKPKEKTSILLTHVVAGGVKPVSETSEDLRFAVAVAEFGMLLRDSQFKADSDYKSVVALAKDAKTQDDFGYKGEFIRLVNMAEKLDQRTAQK